MDLGKYLSNKREIEFEQDVLATLLKLSKEYNQSLSEVVNTLIKITMQEAEND